MTTATEMEVARWKPSLYGGETAELMMKFPGRITGLAVLGGKLYVATARRVYRFKDLPRSRRKKKP